MELLTLTLKGFRSYREIAEIDFRQIPHAAIVGGNGAGKSTLLEAIEWALYGTSRSDDRTGVIAIGMTECEVLLSFAIGGEQYTIKRTRQCRTKTGGATLDIFNGVECMSEKTIALTQAALIVLIGVKREAFLSCAMIRQGDHGRFTGAKPAARRALLREMLHLGDWELAAKNARARALDASRRRDVEEAQLQRPALMDAPAERERLKIDVVKLESESDRLTRIREVQIGELEAAQVDMGKRKSELAQIAIAEGAYKAAQRHVASIESTLRQTRQAEASAEQEHSRTADLDTLVRKGGGESLINYKREQITLGAGLKELSARSEEVAKRHADLRVKWAGTNEKVRAREQQIARAEQESALVDKVPCDEECGRRCPLLEMAHSRRDELHQIRGTLAPLQAQRAAERSEGERLASALNSVTADHARVTKTWEANHRQIDRIERPLQAARQALDMRSLADVVQRLANVTVTVTEQEASLSAALDRVAQMSPPNVVALQMAHDTAERLCVSLRSALGMTAANLQTLLRSIHEKQTRLALVGQLIEEAARRQQALAQAQRDIARWRRVADTAALAPVLLIEEFAVPAIEDVANEILAKISNGMSVRIETQRQLKSGAGTSEKIDIIIRDDIGERPFEDFSGGEQFRVNIAIALALSSLSQHDSRSPLNCIFLDEGWGSLDKDGIAGLSEVVAGLAEFYDVVWVITHVEAAAECLPAQVRIQAGPNGSTIECR